MHTYILITGASSGIGEAYAKAYAEKGKNLIIVARSKDKLDMLAIEFRNKYHILVEVIPLDLSEEFSADKLFNEIKKRELHVTVLVNNAGFATKGLFSSIDYEQQHKEMQLNMLALTELSYLFLAEMTGKNHGTIINVASAASFNPLPYSAVYAATKAYVLSFTESLNYEYRDKGIRVVAVCPGATDTNFFSNFGAVTKKMRKPEEVVNTTFKALDKFNTTICADGTFCKLQIILHRITTRKFALNFMGRTGRKTWG